MKTKSFIFLLLTLVSFLSCNPPVPRPDRTPFCIATPNTNLVEGDFIGLETVCGIDSILSTTYVYEINDHITYIPDGRGGEWLLDTRPDTEIPTMYITTFYYRKYKDPLHVRVNAIVTTKYVTSQFYTAEKEGH